MSTLTRVIKMPTKIKIDYEELAKKEATRKELAKLYREYCKELSQYLYCPIGSKEARRIFNNYWDWHNCQRNKVTISYLRDFSTNEIKGFIIMDDRMIEQIYVKPKYRKQDIGRKLLFMGTKTIDMERRKNHKHFELIVLPTNKGGLEFWKEVTKTFYIPLKRSYKKDFLEGKYYVFAI